jgi:acetyltransferase-like isoleucine patch superfamily enzyme
MNNPANKNKRRVMDHYGYHGVFGEVQYYYRFITSRILQTLALLAPHPSIIVYLNKMRGVKIGRHVYIGQLVYIDSRYPNLITLEDNVSIGVNSMILAHSDPGYSTEIEEKFYPAEIAPTIIKRGAWIAPATIIRCGVTIGEHSVVGTRSLVTSDVEPYTVVAGNAAKLIRRLESKY